MGWRGPAVVALMLALGLTGGYAASRASTPSADDAGVAEPVAARGPSHPVAQESTPAPDPVGAPLQPGLPLETTTMGSGRFAISLPVPEGWTRNENATNEAKWKEPGTANNTYVLRVEQITSQDLTVAEAIRQRVAELRSEQEGVRIRARDGQSLEYTYTSDEGTARHSFMRWLDLSGSGQADVEVVVHGRESDVAGTRDLIRRIAQGMRLGTAR